MSRATCHVPVCQGGVAAGARRLLPARHLPRPDALLRRPVQLAGRYTMLRSFVDCLLVESTSTLVEASSEYSKKKLSRISLTPPPQDNTLVISEVRPEDKGVYRCYREGGDQKEFAEVDVDNVDMPTVVMRTLWCLGNILPQVPAVFQRRLLTMMTRHSAEISYE